DIQRYSRTIGMQAEMITMSNRPGLPKAKIALWGKVTLQPLDPDSLKALADGRSLGRGFLIDFLGDFTRSAREGLAVYRIDGAAGFVWAASYDENGRGTLRFAAVDASQYSKFMSAPLQAPKTGEDADTEKTKAHEPNLMPTSSALQQ